MKILLIVVAIIIIYVIFTRNKLVELQNKVDEAFSTMDVYLKKRWDLIPSVVASVKGYAKHESETFENVTNMRSKSYDTLMTNDKIDKNLALNDMLYNISMIVENYPELKADETFLKLNETLNSVETDIENSRKYYNAVVRMYNNQVEMFPSNLVSKMFSYETKRMFEAKEEERTNVKFEL